MAVYVEHDLSSARRVLVAGDLHGCLDLLLAKLAELEYSSQNGDRLILLGDILDRGPDVLAIRDWLNANPDVLCLLGNHDQMLMGALDPRWATGDANVFNLMRNGGDWLQDFAPAYPTDDPENRKSFIVDMIASKTPHTLIDPQVVAFARMISQAPVAMRIRTPGGNDVGMVHADLPTATWADMQAALLSEDGDIRRDCAISCMWKRKRFDNAKRIAHWGAPDPADFRVPDIGHVFFGHSITEEPMRIGNVSWIDTGAYKHNNITVVDADAWIAGA